MVSTKGKKTTKKTSQDKKVAKSKKLRPKNISYTPSVLAEISGVSPTSSIVGDGSTAQLDGSNGFPGGADLYPINATDDQIALGDFHLHTTHSDGILTPSELVALVAQRGVKLMSLTDHDTMAGVSDAIACGLKHGVTVIPGVEISAEAPGAPNIHILGYFSPVRSTSTEHASPWREDPLLCERLQSLRASRYSRGKRMLELLAQPPRNIQLSWERVLELAGEAAPGRPHVARVLLEGGHVASFPEAFEKYLGNDGPCYAKMEPFSPEEAVELIAACGGISVLAHPWCCQDAAGLVARLAPLGLHGVEVFHRGVATAHEYQEMAVQYGLLQMGGSDFHGLSLAKEKEKRATEAAVAQQAGSAAAAPTPALGAATNDGGVKEVEKEQDQSKEESERFPGDIPMPIEATLRFMLEAQRVWGREKDTPPPSGVAAQVPNGGLVVDNPTIGPKDASSTPVVVSDPSDLDDGLWGRDVVASVVEQLKCSGAGGTILE